MPVVVDNNFSQDTYGTRTERLIAIQGNFASIQPELQAPAHIVTWAVDCFDVYSNLLAVSGLEMSESETATAVVAEKVAALEEAYQNIRYIGTSIYSDNLSVQNEYGFITEFPDSRDDMFRVVDKVVLAYDKHTDAGLTPLIPLTLITRLTNARGELETAIANQDSERFDARKAVNDASTRFVSDTKILNELKSWFYVMIGKEDPRITLIGMVNPGTVGGGKQIAAPQNLRYETDYMKVVWDAVENATSYSLEVSNDGLNFTELTTTTDPEFSYIPYDAHSWFRVRSRSANGYSEYSSTIDFWYYEPLPAPANFAAEIIPGHECRLSWEMVHSATTYRVYISDVAFGEPEGPFIPFLNTGQLEYTTTLTPGRRMYFKVTCFNPYQAESAFSNTAYVEVTGGTQ
jgi:hypothetical protein